MTTERSGTPAGDAPASTPILLVLDDDEGARKTAELAGQVFDWNVVTAQDKADLDGKVSAGWTPHMILMDYAMPNRDELVTWINDKAWNRLTVLVTGGSLGTDIASVAEDLKFADGWAKPFPMGRLRDKVNSMAALDPTQVTKKRGIGDRVKAITDVLEMLKSKGEAALKAAHDGAPSFDTLADELGPAITILKVETRLIARENASSGRSPLAPADWTRLFLLHAEIAAKAGDEKSAPRADFVDWDQERGSWMHMRLYKVGEWYWLTRDWLNPGKGEAQAMADLASQSGLDSRLDALCKLLAERWGITRMRFYEVAQLPDDSRPDKLPQLWVTPRRQYGGGFEPSADAWMREAFLYDANSNTPENLEGWSVAQVSDPPLTKNLSPEGHAQGVGCQSIRWGNAKTRMQFLIWESPRVFDHGVATALLAVDRRYDHIGAGESGPLDQSALLMMQDGRLKDLDQDEGRTLAHALLPAAASYIRQSLEAEHLQRKEKWNDELTRLVVTHIGGNRGAIGNQDSPPRRPAFASLSAIFAEMCQVWPGLWGASAVEQKPTDWYIALKVGEDWRTVSGVGGAYDAFKDADLLHQQWPYSVGFAKAESIVFEGSAQDGANLEAPHRYTTVYQNFSSVWEEECARDPELAASYGDCASALGRTQSWAAVPMQVDDKTWALMVIHWAVPNAVNEKQVRLLAHAARRLLPPLLVADSEKRRREDWTGAVVHELKTDALALAHWIKGLGAPQSDENVLMSKHYADGLLALALDYLTVMRGTSDRDEFSETHDWDAALLQTIDPWLRLYGDFTTVWLNPSDQDPEPLQLPLTQASEKSSWGTQTLPHPAHFRRVLRVLMHNAFRHGLGEVQIRTRLARGEGDTVFLHLTIANTSAPDALNNLRSSVDPELSQVVATKVRRSLGLSNAFRLSKAAGGKLGVRGCLGQGAGPTSVVARLRWPLRPPNETSSAHQ